MSDTPELSICIVSWNVRGLLLACIASIKKNVSWSYQIIVVDNASSDGSPAAVRQAYPDVIVIENQKNVGFAVANNQAIRQATAPWIVLLNPDTEILHDPFPTLIEQAKRSDNVACVAPEILNPDGTHQRSVRTFPKLSNQIIVLLKLRHFLFWLPTMKRYLAEPIITDNIPIDVEQVMGACMVIKRASFKEIGLLDEHYPNWFEEVDWCIRVKLNGRRIVYVPSAQIVHYGNESFGQVLSLKKHRWLLTGLRLYARKFWPKWQWPIVDLLAGVSYLLTIVQTTIKPR